MKHVNNLYLAILVVIITALYTRDMQIVIIPLAVFIFIALVINDAKKNKRAKKETIDEFSSVIEGILISLREVWGKYQEATKDPLQQKRVVKTVSSLHTVPVEFMLALPADWRWKVSKLYPIPSIFSKGERIQIDEFCCNIIGIISLYNQIQDLGDGTYDVDALPNFRSQWETQVSEVIEKGNPLKKK